MFCAQALFTISMLSLLNLPYVSSASLNFSCLFQSLSCLGSDLARGEGS